MKKVTALFLLMALATIILAGCGETMHGIGKDVNRVGKGIQTIFIRDN